MSGSLLLSEMLATGVPLSKLASTVGVDNAKFGFTELPVDDEELYKEIEFAPASPLKKKQSALQEKSEEDNLAEEKAAEFKKK